MTTPTYDANGNRLSLTDARGNTTQYQYDALDQRTHIIDPLGMPSTDRMVGFWHGERSAPTAGSIVEPKVEDDGPVGSATWPCAGRSSRESLACGQ